MDGSETYRFVYTLAVKRIESRGLVLKGRRKVGRMAVEDVELGRTILALQAFQARSDRLFNLVRLERAVGIFAHDQDLGIDMEATLDGVGLTEQRLGHAEVGPWIQGSRIDLFDVVDFEESQDFDNLFDGIVRVTNGRRAKNEGWVSRSHDDNGRKEVRLQSFLFRTNTIAKAYN